MISNSMQKKLCLLAQGLWVLQSGHRFLSFMHLPTGKVVNFLGKSLRSQITDFNTVRDYFLGAGEDVFWASTI